MSEVVEKVKHAGGRPLKFASVAELQEAIDGYFVGCWDYKRDMFGNRIVDKSDPTNSKAAPSYIMVQSRPYTITGLAVALDTTRDLLLDYENRDKFSDTIKKAKQRCHQYAEEALYTKGAAGAIFNLKNNYGWVDKTEVDSTVVADVTSNGETVKTTDLDVIMATLKANTEVKTDEAA